MNGFTVQRTGGGGGTGGGSLCLEADYDPADCAKLTQGPFLIPGN